MRILSKKITAKNSSGSIKIQAEEAEDMYLLYNLISEGDSVTAETTRNVSKETNAGATTKKRMTLRLTITVESIEFDSEQCSLRLNGRNSAENEFVKLGQYHTLELEIGHPICIEKECWDSMHLHSLSEAADVSARAELAALVLQEGLASLCLITPAMTITRLRVERSLPKKRQGGGGEEHAKARQRFFSEVFEGLRKYINFDVVRAVLVGSPGFVKDDFMAYFDAECSRRAEAAHDIGKYRARFISAHASSGHRRAVDELLADPALQSTLANIKAVDQVKILQSFESVFALDPDRACFGPADVEYADSQLAVAHLLISDSLFRAREVKQRQKYVALVESVKEHGGQVMVFSSLHVSGEQLVKYSGVAAILRFPLAMPEEEEVVVAPPVVDGGYDDDDAQTRHDQSATDMLGEGMNTTLLGVQKFRESK